MKILLLSRYGSLGASSRVRYLQYLDDFYAQGWTVDVIPLLTNSYLESLYTDTGGSRWCQMFWGYADRLVNLMKVCKYDLLVIEKELFPFFPALFERFLSILRVPYIVDYDDALFHRYDRHRLILVRWLLGRKIDVIMRHATVVVTGNEYLADRARQAGSSHVEVIPTVVDTKRYQPRVGQANTDLVVGWIGTPKTSRYLQPLLPIFSALHKEFSVRFVAVGARQEDFVGSPVEALPWSEETEVVSIQQFDIGIMPLEDSPWERGKCGYKLIQYMACGIPVVASPVGVNQNIVSAGVNGFFADKTDDWYESLAKLLRMPSEALAAMGSKGRARIKAEYSKEVQAPRLLDIFHNVAKCRVPFD